MEKFPSMVEYHESTVSQSKREQEFEDAVKQRAQKLQNENGTGLDLEDGEAAAQGCLNDHIQNAMNDVMQAHRNTFGHADFDETEINESYAQLNVDQKRIVDTIVAGVCNGEEQVRLIVSGPGGTGKSRVIHVTSHMVCNKLKSNALPVVVCAPTGLSAFNIGGSTIHRVLCLPVEHGKPADYSRLNQEQLTTIRVTLKNLKLLIIDEVSMVSSLTLLYIHLRLTEIMCSHALFGSVSVVFFADFLLLPPVKGNQPFIPVTYLEAKQRIGSVSSLDLWQSFTYDELTINMRQKGDAVYANLLSNVRVGIFTDEHNSLLQNRMITPGRRATVTEICSRYQSLVAENLSPLILMPRTSSCDEINQAMLIITGSQIYTITAIDTQDTITDERMTAKVTKAYKKNRR
jgi:DNA replication protein DnaC